MVNSDWFKKVQSEEVKDGFRICSKCENRIYFSARDKRKTCSCGNSLGRYHYDPNKFYDSHADSISLGGEKSMELPVEKTIRIEDGVHEGLITKVEYRTKPYTYTDVFVETQTSGGKVELRYGCPTKLTKETKLGKLLLGFGAGLKIGEKVDPESYLVGKKVKFQTINEMVEGKGTFARIVEGSLKPI